MQQHLFTLPIHTYKVQEGVMARGRLSCKAPQQVRLVLHREPHQAVSLFGLSLPGGRSTQEGLLLHGKTSLTQEREILWQGEVHTGESPLMLANVLSVGGFWKAHSAGSSAGALFICPSPPGYSPLLSFSLLLIGYTFGSVAGCSRYHHIITS
jgi:hypothetical protein